MRILPLLITYLFLPIITAKFSPICIRVLGALTGRPNDLFTKFQREICDQGCQPTVPHWDLWTRNNTFLPAVRSLMKHVDNPRQEEAMVRLGDDVADVIKRQCGPLLQGRDICSDDETLAAFGTCFKKGFVRAALTNLPTLLPLASEEVCREQYEWLQKDELWEVIIPGKMREYAGVCRGLGGELGAMLVEELLSG
ncbi:hypothetical protein CBS63078_1604 [Aspergillus niger]|nr:hypothetical protein CBS115989_3479 [Aspergillus niger]KAI2833032.1 hypothetical protein CBS133816_870 [Aspergillus niger]KAI2842075.1 hypothetical protein CBS11350_5994 [Aspergillus niger]KAI2860869.1 hypothetical protein CBS11232_1112 [Aspergillus niger]KAI2864406.1 hypothetical protein CBS12448_2899 [Aspergillus niger]|eukprot:XP_001400421.2 hypothetical protein ANI_1_3184024 [Aspergillus niger CBS 513.88]